jgi:hypothetical protein
VSTRPSVIFRNSTLYSHMVLILKSAIELFVYLVLSYSSITCRNYLSGLIDRASQDHEQLLELVFWLLLTSFIIHGLHYRIEEVDLLTSIIIHVIEELQNQSRFPAPR